MTRVQMNHSLRLLAGGRGFEPRLTGPEPVVLPLDDPPNRQSILTSGQVHVNTAKTFTAENTEDAERESGNRERTGNQESAGDLASCKKGVARTAIWDL
jgi:hypothetical protein